MRKCPENTDFDARSGGERFMRRKKRPSKALSEARAVKMKQSGTSLWGRAIPANHWQTAQVGFGKILKCANA
jgi:hypothetical protein